MTGQQERGNGFFFEKLFVVVIHALVSKVVKLGLLPFKGFDENLEVFLLQLVNLSRVDLVRNIPVFVLVVSKEEVSFSEIPVKTLVFFILLIQNPEAFQRLLSKSVIG